jgi:glycerol-3-phosphate cytidylyltransferase
MIRGFIAGAFDIIHPGYVQMLKEAKQYCDFLIVGLHEDPEVNGKLKPILSVDERMEILYSIKYIDQVISYKGEEGLLELLEDLDPTIRFLGDDYKDKTVTGDHLAIPICYLDRSHGWSTTKYKTLIHDQINGKDLQ